MTPEPPPETLRLPLSGLVLVADTDDRGCCQFRAVGTDLRLQSRTAPTVRAWCRNDAGHEFLTRDKALAWLDEHAMELRRALLPADAREVVVQALALVNRQMRDRAGGVVGQLASCSLREIAVAEEQAEAVLLALGVAP